MGEGRRHYERKRLEIFGTLTHFIEIALLRAGQPLPVRNPSQQVGYHILISRASQRPKAELFTFGIQQAIPDFYLPLQAGDNEPLVALNQILHALYDRAGYDLRIDYTKAPPPPTLSLADAAWLETHLKAVGMR